MGIAINNDIFRLTNLAEERMSRKAYAILLELIDGLESEHVDLYRAA